MDSDGSTSVCGDDDSFDCSSSDCSNEQIKTKKLVELPNGSSCPKDKYLSTLRFSRCAMEDGLVERNKVPCHKRSGSLEIYERLDTPNNAGASHSGIVSSYKSVDMGLGELSQSCSILHRNYTWLKSSDFDLIGSNRKTNISEETICFRPLRPALKDGTLPKDELDGENKTPSSVILQSSDFRDLNFLSKNPMLSIKAFTRSSSKPGASCCDFYGKSLPCFEFSSVEDAVKICAEKLDSGCVHVLEYRPSPKGNSDSLLVEKTEVPAAQADTGLKRQNKECAISTNVSGGSSWESLLGTLRGSGSKVVSHQREVLSDIFEIPLDFIIEKCLLQEIWLQYPSFYVDCR